MIRLRVCLFAVLMFCAQSLRAGIVLYDPVAWTNAPSLEGWTNAAPIGTEVTTLSNPGTGGQGGGGDGYLRISFAAQGGPPAAEQDTIYTTGTNYTGSYQESGLALSFFFYAEDLLPPEVGGTILYLHSAISSNLWEFEFSNSVVGVWEPHAIPFQYDAGWSGSGGAAEFMADLANVDWIGVNIARRLNIMAQDYGIDNWTYWIPEPGSISILAAALGSLAIAFRSRRRSS